MYIDKRKTKEGVYYSFSYVDENTGKRIRLKKSEHPYFKEYSEALEWAKSQAAYQASMKAKVESRLAWKKKYYQFDALIERYLRYQEKQAPNSYRESKIYLEQYVFPFFLETKKSNNVNMWHMFFNEFRDWLLEAKTTKGGTKISISSANHAIRALNTFLTFLVKYNLMDAENRIPCPSFPTSMLNYRDYSDVIESHEFDNVYERLLEINLHAAEFYYVLYHTGMRFNELFSLPMSSLFSGKLDGPIGEELKLHNLDCYGYIVLESQCASDCRVRNGNGSLQRKPLKGRKKIQHKDNRIIPIMDKYCWNILARRFKNEKERYLKKEFGSVKTDYILFEDLKFNDASIHLRQAHEELRLRHKPYHCCRHSYATFLVGKTRSYFLARNVLGHRSDAFERYNHIYEQISLNAKQNLQEIDEIA